jgi:hypothetical protein
VEGLLIVVSNPGVIKLAEKKIGNHKLWIDDNIGESIHIHYDQFRIELTIDEFRKLADSLRGIFDDLVGGYAKDLDERFIYNQIDDLLNIKEIQEIQVNLSKLRAFDDNGLRNLPDCDRVKALRGEIDINSKKNRGTNYFGQTNNDRLLQNLEYMQTHNYPEESGYIYVISDRNLILDGWHRASVLYYLYGDISIPVKAVILKSVPYDVKRIFPNGRIDKDDRLVLYGAGKNGIDYYEQLRSQNYKVVAWWDKNAGEIKERCGYSISYPLSMASEAYDYILVSLVDDEEQKKVKDYLIENGVVSSRVIC